MVLEYGARRAPRRNVLVGAAGALITLAVVALVVLAVQTRATRMADAREWTVAGPPCASATAASLAAAGETASQAMSYYGVRFARAHGALRCSQIGYDEGRSGEDLPVCQFDHPGALVVTTATGRYAFLLPPTSPATVQVRHGVPQCVIAASVEID
jgi:hypothetical protein